MTRLITHIVALGALAFAGTAHAQTVIQGVYILDLSIVLTTAVPTGGSVNCGLTLTAAGDAAGTNIESASSVATISGGTASCTLTIPYRWTLDTPSSDTLSAGYSVSMVAGGTTPTGELRSGEHSLHSISGIPATGTHTTVSAITRL